MKKLVRVSGALLSVFIFIFLNTSEVFSAGAVNLIANPAMENVSPNSSSLPASWFKGGYGVNTRILTYPALGVDGTKAVKVEITNYTSGDAKWFFENTPVTGGQQLSFSDSYQSTTGSYITIQYKLQDGTFRYIDIGSLPASSSWTQFTKTFTVPTNYPSPVISMTVFHLIKSAGYIVTDNYSLQDNTPDTIPPLVSINPVGSNPVSGTVTLSADSSDNIAVAGVQFKLNGNNLGNEITNQPYDFTWDTTSVSDGLYSLVAVARDASGNISTSSSIQINILNAPAPVPDTGTIKVNVIVINNNDGTKNGGDFTLAVDTQGVISGVATSFPVGLHIVSQTADPNYTSVISGACDAQGNITLAAGDSKVCTITNDDIPPVPSIPTNFIINPSAETVSPNSSSLPLSWSKGGYGINTRTLTYNNDSQDGSKGLKAEITNYTTGDAKWYFQPLTVSSGQKYIYTEYYKSNIPSEINIQYQLQDGTFKYAVLDSNLPAVSDWIQTSFIFTVPTYTSPVVKMTVFHIINSIGWLSTDNYSLNSYTPPPSDPNNAILNPSVETVSVSSSSLPAFWSRNSSLGSTATFTYPVLGYNSTKAMQTNVTNYTGGSGARWYFQSVPVNPGEDYAFSDYFKSTTQSYLSVQFLLNDGTYEYLDLTPLAISTAWKQAKGVFTVPPGAISLTIIHSIKSVGMLTTDNYVLKKLPGGAFSSGMISLNFDDGLKSVYENAMPILNNAGIKSSQYVITEDIGGFGYWTEAQLSDVAGWGHEIGSHTRTHPHLTLLNSTELQDEIVGSKIDLENLGYSPVTFTYPFGSYNDIVVQVVKDAGFRGARSVHSGFNTKNSDLFALNDQHVESDTTIEQIKSWIDEAISTKTWLILEIHDIDYSGVKYSTTPEILQQIVDYINLTNIKVVSNNEGISAILN